MHRLDHPWIHGHSWNDGFGWWPGTLLSVLSTVFLLALLIGLILALLRWIIPYLKGPPRRTSATLAPTNY